MGTQLRKAALGVATLVTTLNVTNALDAVGIGSLLSHYVANSAGLLHRTVAFLLSKWTLAFAMLTIGMFGADWLIRRSMRLERTPGTGAGIYLGFKRWMLIRRLKHRWFGRFVDNRFELSTMNDALTAPHLGLPALPSIDPDDEAGMEATLRYLSVMGSVRPKHLPEARRRVRAIIADLTPILPPVDAVIPRRPSRLRLALLALIEPR